jgi:F-type H+-transporting ATPase subunit delta
VATAAARRYARAAFELASEGKRIDEWRHSLAVIRDLLSGPKIAAVLQNPTIPSSERMKLISQAGVVETEASNLVGLLIESGRVGEAAGIADEFDRLADEAAGKIHALVTSAVELSAEELREMAERLSKRLGAEVSLQSVVDRRLIGGVKVQYGDHLIDASVATRLQQLRRRLADAS